MYIKVIIILFFLCATVTWYCDSDMCDLLITVVMPCYITITIMIVTCNIILLFFIKSKIRKRIERIEKNQTKRVQEEADLSQTLFNLYLCNYYTNFYKLSYSYFGLSKIKAIYIYARCLKVIIDYWDIILLVTRNFY